MVSVLVTLFEPLEVMQAEPSEVTEVGLLVLDAQLVVGMAVEA